MANRGEEKMEDLLRRFYSRRTTNTGRSDCPSEEILADYLDRALGDSEAMRLEEHLAECSLCVEDIIAAYKSARSIERKKVPPAIIDRVLSLVPDSPPKENILDLVVRLIKGSLELVRTSGQLVLSSPPLVVRAPLHAPQTTILRVEKQMAELKFTVEVEPVEAGLCQVAVSGETERKRAADGIRLSLFSGDRERASYLTRHGQAIFDGLSVGEYRIEIADSGTPVGTIRLTLTN